MSLTSITIGGTEYPSYATVAEGDAYLAVDPTRRLAWASLDSTVKGVNLIAATKRLDSLRWIGRKTDPTQATEWPRSGLTFPNGQTVPDNVLPERLLQATILLAGDLAVDPAAMSTSGQSETRGVVQSERIGPKAVSYFYPRRRSPRLPEGNTLLSLVGCWLKSSLVTAPVATGTDARSSFEDVDRLDRTAGPA